MVRRLPPLPRPRAGNRVTDVDGHTYVDFALGDTGAMAGHSPAPTVAAVQRRAGELGGFTTMLPTEDAQWVGAELERRFGMPLWSFTLSATDANRWAIRLARLATGKPKVLVLRVLLPRDGRRDVRAARARRQGAEPRPGNVAPPVDLDLTTRVATWNDLASVEAALAHGDVAVILTEPALTNIGIVLPERGFLEGCGSWRPARHAAADRRDAHLLRRPGWRDPRVGPRARHLRHRQVDRRRDPVGAYGISRDLAEAVDRATPRPGTPTSSTSAASAARSPATPVDAAMRATLGEVLTPEAFAHMIALATAFTAGVQATLDKLDVPWSVSQLGARAEYRFARPAPRTGRSPGGCRRRLDAYLHLAMCNRGILMTPFHNMALMCPATTGRRRPAHRDVPRGGRRAVRLTARPLHLGHPLPRNLPPTAGHSHAEGTMTPRSARRTLESRTTSGRSGPCERSGGYAVFIQIIQGKCRERTECTG